MTVRPSGNRMSPNALPNPPRFRAIAREVILGSLSSASFMSDGMLACRGSTSKARRSVTRSIRTRGPEDGFGPALAGMSMTPRVVAQPVAMKRQARSGATRTGFLIGGSLPRRGYNEGSDKQMRIVIAVGADMVAPVPPLLVGIGLTRQRSLPPQEQQGRTGRGHRRPERQEPPTRTCRLDHSLHHVAALHWIAAWWSRPPLQSQPPRRVGNRQCGVHLDTAGDAPYGQPLAATARPGGHELLRLRDRSGEARGSAVPT